MTINIELIFNSFLLITILSILVERSLALFFEQKWVAVQLAGKGLKEIIAFGVCFAVCKTWNIDVISSILSIDSKLLGIFITAAATAGGSKASIVLFKEVLGVSKGP